METKVTRRMSFHTMSISAKFPSGAHFKYTISNEPCDETLELAFSTDTKVLNEQMKIFKKWLEKKSSFSGKCRCF
jgi:hypothetical protein